MKRSEINHAISNAKILIDEYKWALPKWAYWSKSDYDAQPLVAEYLRTHQMGWDVTDFGRGNFNKEGIILAKATIDFSVPIELIDRSVEVHSHCSRIGTKSFDLSEIFCRFFISKI